MRDFREQIQTSLLHFETLSLQEAAVRFFSALGYKSEKTADFGKAPASFLQTIESGSGTPFNSVALKLDRWLECAFLFQLTNDEIPSLAHEPMAFLPPSGFAPRQIESLSFLAIELKEGGWNRTDLAHITREINRRFSMPAILLFKTGPRLSLAVIDRRDHRRKESLSVLESRISIIQDVLYKQPHRAHLEIFNALAFPNLDERPSTFRRLYDLWMELLSIQTLNQRFYTELFHWYIWATKHVAFPPGGGQDEEQRNSLAVIRLLTRLIFLWFLKEKGLVDGGFFDARTISSLLEKSPTENPEDGNYYLAILQNLFFATLNTEKEKRKWASSGPGMKSDRYIQHLFRYSELFQNKDQAFQSFQALPFLNGGLFDCLDREIKEEELKRNPHLKPLLTKEGDSFFLRVDGFTRRNLRPSSKTKGDSLRVPNKLFFFGEAGADLNSELGTQSKKTNVSGLFHLFSRYKFTVEENTPLEEEIALDPELLGRVFENLLASYNPDTRTTARKLSGSFYTPREVVDYMVEEALQASFLPHLSTTPDATKKLRYLFCSDATPHDFTPSEVNTLIAVIEQTKLLDPACGSGAFLMGSLATLVRVLRKLDPGNQRWKAQNRAPLEMQLQAALQIKDSSLRQEREEDANEALAQFDRDFACADHADYTRKLYLIEKCIHGVDIQPIAVQIAKLRFFISLLVSQQTHPDLPNFGLSALPNLETKIIAADSLRSPFEKTEQYGLTVNLLKVEELKRQLLAIEARYISARTTKAKEKQREKSIRLREEIAALLEGEALISHEEARALAYWNPFDQNTSASFFDPEWMFQVKGGFHLVLGNPPYVRQEDIRPLKEQLKRAYPTTYTGTADLYVFFYERAIRLLQPGGSFAFITSNKWFRAKYGEKLREWLTKEMLLNKILDFGDAPVFDAIAYPTIVLATRRQPDAPLLPAHQVRVINWTPDVQKQFSVEDFPLAFDSCHFDLPQSSLTKESWHLEPSSQRELLERIRKAGIPLGTYISGRFYRGILTGLNEAFVIDGATRQALIEKHPGCAAIIKPFLRGRDVKRWRVSFSEETYLIQIESSENRQHPWSELVEEAAEKKFAKCFPSVYRHFLPFSDAMKERYDQGRFFWELRACAYWEEFEKPKIIYPDIALSPQFAWEVGEYCSGDTTFFIRTEERHLLAVLNSAITRWFFSQISAQVQNNYLRFKTQYCEQIPVPKADADQKGMIDGVIELFSLSSSPVLERLLNALVYELFFPEDLHSSKLCFFRALKRVGLPSIGNFPVEKQVKKAKEWALEISRNDHALYAMLFDLDAVSIVRMIEGKEQG